MSFRQRRQTIRLVNRSEGLPIEDVKWLHTQGFKGHAEVPSPATWYRPDGTPLPGRTDAYHLRLYRLKGWTLRHPVIEEPAPKEPRRALPVIASRLVRFLGDRAQWQGTASELANGPVDFGRSAIGLSMALGTPKVSAALADEGITVARGYRGKSRTLRVSRRRLGARHA
jgi:hypothetical protein